MAMIPYEEAAMQMVAPDTRVSVDPAAVRAATRALVRSGRYIARGVSGARKKARKRRKIRQERRVQPMLRGLPAPMRYARNPLALHAMSAPMAYGMRMRQDYSGLDTYRVKHSEYVADINGSVGFEVQRFEINPARPVTFPWLASLAPNFEQYRFKMLKFMVKPQAPSTKPGVVMLAFDYDPTDPPPTEKAELLAYDGAERVNSWASTSTTMKSVEKKYTAESRPSETADIRQSDAANLYVATAAQDNTDAITELWVEYEVELITPQARKSCDAFGLLQSAWNPSNPFSVGSITNPSTRFALDSGPSSVVCATGGNYHIYANVYTAAPNQFADLSVDPPVTLVYKVNGVTLLQNSSAGPTDLLPIQRAASGTSQLVAPVVLGRGDVVSVEISSGTHPPMNVSLLITPLDA